MVSKIKSKIKQDLIRRWGLEKKFYEKDINLSFSQEGEDLILARIFGAQKSGLYVDIGAHHPTRFSNTFKFYLKGWRGINVDANPGSMKIFNDFRGDDINLELAISDQVTSLIFYRFNEPALNTFSSEEATKKNGLGDYKIIEEVEISTVTLADVLNKNLKKGKEIDFLSIDVEGLDLNVIKSNDWSRFQPKVIVIEELNSDLSQISKGETYKYLLGKGYTLFARTFNSSFYKR